MCVSRDVSVKFQMLPAADAAGSKTMGFHWVKVRYGDRAQQRPEGRSNPQDAGL